MTKIEVKIEKLKNSEIEISGSIPFEKLEQYRKTAIKNVGEHISIDGFRKGHIPEKILVEKVGEMTILHEMAELALQNAYPSIIIDNKIDAITSPQVSITKLASGNPMEFKIKLAVMPEVKLPDYKKIAKKELAKKEDAIEVTEEEVEKTIKQILSNQHNHEHDENGACVEKEEDKELTDEMVKQFGDFENVEAFKTRVKEDLKVQKERQATEKRRMAIIEEIANEMKIELPEILIKTELRKMMAEMSDNISRMGLKFDKYLEHIKKTEDDLKKEWRTDAEKRVKIQMLLGKIAQEENIVPNQKDVDENVASLMSFYKDAKKENVEIYVKMLISNEEVFKILESQK